MKPSSRSFSANARAALRDQVLQQALGKARSGFVDKRRAAVQALPEFDRLKQAGREIKEHSLAHLDLYLERFEAQVQA